MQRPEAATLLHAWERGATQGPTMRALLLLAAALPGETPAALAATGIGRRDAKLLELREALFGGDLECVASCAHCNERIELSFPVRGIRAGSAESGAIFQHESGGYRVKFRLPCSSDLLGLAGQAGTSSAARELLSCCVIEACTEDGAIHECQVLPPAVIESIDRLMGEVDSQAQVEIDVTCPACECVARATFDIATHLWSELETWARAQLREIHALASGYGWSEAQILALGAARRRAYLELLGAA
jgi:hypothetical protein